MGWARWQGFKVSKLDEPCRSIGENYKTLSLCDLATLPLLSKIFDKRIGHIRTVVVRDAGRSALNLLHQPIEVVA